MKEEQVRDILNQYIEGTYTANIPLLEGVFHKDAHMVGYLNKELLIGTPAPFIRDMRSQPSMKTLGFPYQAQIRDIEINGNVARATIHERGFRGGAELINHFHLLFDKGEWKIISKTFSTIE